MKRGRCPKCGSTALPEAEPGHDNSFPTGLFSNAKIQRYVCTEEWIAEESMKRLRHSWDIPPEK